VSKLCHRGERATTGKGQTSNINIVFKSKRKLLLRERKLWRIQQRTPFICSPPQEAALNRCTSVVCPSVCLVPSIYLKSENSRNLKVDT